MQTTETQVTCFIDDVTRGIAMQYLQDLDSPTALGIYLCLVHRDDESACTHEIDPRVYQDYATFCADYCASSLLSKYSVGPAGADQLRRQRALEKFSACEDHLRDCYPLLKSAISCGNTAVTSVLYRAREKISRLLGKVTSHFNIGSCGFGPGSSSSIPRRKAHPSNKFLSADVSSGCAPLVGWFFTDVGFPRPILNLVEHSRIEYVPKNFRIDRVIAVEPDWNIFFQKGFGKAIRRILRRVGVDLDNGAEIHQKLALFASRTGLLATIDLSAASDSISTLLIRFLLPDEWFIALNSVRTDRIVIEGQTVPLRKFSSMGNGFTFELESLVFYALAKSACEEMGIEGRVSSFGDDIILPTEGVGLLTEVLHTAGFRLNQRKSFSTGLFRESCGSHFFDGHDVKPIYLDAPLRSDIECFKFCNAVRRLSLHSYHQDVSEGPFRDTYRRCKSRIRRVFLIPFGSGDGGLHSTFEEVTPATVRSKDPSICPYPSKIEGFRVRCLLPNTAVSEVTHDGMLIHKLRRCGMLQRSAWHDMRWPVFLASLADLKTSDIRPETGNDVMTSQTTVSYHVGFMHVSHWLGTEAA